MSPRGRGLLAVWAIVSLSALIVEALWRYPGTTAIGSVIGLVACEIMQRRGPRKR